MICMLADIKNYNKACTEIAYHRIFYMQKSICTLKCWMTPLCIHIFIFKEQEGDVSTVCKKLGTQKWKYGKIKYCFWNIGLND